MTLRKQPDNQSMIYYLDNAGHREELKRLAKEGGHTVMVAASADSEPLKLTNLRHDPRTGYFTGDAEVVANDPS